MKYLKTFENLTNTAENNINTYIKTHKNDIDFDRIREFLDHIKSKGRLNTKTDHMALLVLTLRKINNTIILKELWELFFEYGFNVNRKEPEHINIITVIYRDYIRNYAELPEMYYNIQDALNKYKNVIKLLLDEGIDLLTKRTREKINFFNILENDNNLNLFIDNFSNNENFMKQYEIYNKEKKIREFNL